MRGKKVQAWRAASKGYTNGGVNLLEKHKASEKFWMEQVRVYKYLM